MAIPRTEAQVAASARAQESGDGVRRRNPAPAFVTSYFSTSTISASGAFFWTEAMPALALLALL